MSRPSVLLVDDRPENLLALRAVLEPLDLNLVDASSGDHALKKLLEHEFAVILLDVQMPDMDGFEATAEIRQRERARGERQVIVATTAHALKGDEERCLSAGMDAYISKPLDPKQLFSLLARFGALTHS
jgi:CheY-like chemotaxis protein